MTRILYVDDDADVREVAMMALEFDGGFEVRACATGRDAIDIAPVWLPDLILLDVMMPAMDGPETFAALRSNPAVADIPVVFITARTNTADVARLSALGAAGVMAKPFDPILLGDQVRSFIVTP